MHTNGKKRNIPFVDLAAQHTSISKELYEKVSKVIHNTSFILGWDVEAFEQEFAAFCETCRGFTVY